MRKSFVVLVVAAVVGSATGFAPATSASDSLPTVDPRLESVLISVTDLGRVGDAGLLAHNLQLAHGADIRPSVALDDIDLIAAEVTPAGAAALSRVPYVEAVEVAHELHPLLDVSVPAVGAAAMQSAGVGGTGKIVAVIDSGVDTTTPGLVGVVTDEACFVPVAVSPPSVLVEGCPAGSTGTGAAAPCVSLPSDCSHGTHIAGIVAGVGPVFTGVAPDASVLAVRVFGVVDHHLGAGPEPIIPEAGVLQAMEHVYNAAAVSDIVAVNLSLGGPPGQSCVSAQWTDVVTRLASRGVAVVAASGNDSWGAVAGNEAVSFPACLPGVISVGSTTAAGSVSSFTNSSSVLDMLAPGDPITSTVPLSLSASGYAGFQGTSFASPHVAAAMALLDQIWPDMGVESKRALLRTTGSMITRTTPSVGDRELRFPQMQLANILGFTPFADSIGDAFWMGPAQWARYTGVSSGLDGVSFGASSSLNRAQAVTFLWNLMGQPDVVLTLPFTDVPAGAFYEKAVKWALSNGITSGTSTTTFSPEGLVTRWQVATFMWHMAGDPVPAATSSFLDVPRPSLFAVPVDWMAANNITAGTDASGLYFSPEWVIDRGQMITFLYRLISNPDAWTGSVTPPPLAVLF